MALSVASCARTVSLVAPMHEKCDAALTPSARISRTAPKVPSCVEPPAPKVTEQNSGWSAYSCWRTPRSFSAPSGVLGGKNSRLRGIRSLANISISVSPAPHMRGWCSARLAGENKKFAVTVTTFDGRVEPRGDRQAQFGAGLAQALFDDGIHGRVFDNPPLAHLARLQLKLRLHQG